MINRFKHDKGFQAYMQIGSAYSFMGRQLNVDSINPIQVLENKVKSNKYISEEKVNSFIAILNIIIENKKIINADATKDIEILKLLIENYKKCKFKVGDKVISKFSVYSDTGNNKESPKSLGREIYVVNKIEYWEQGKAFLVYGEKSDKRNCEVCHHEEDIKICK